MDKIAESSSVVRADPGRLMGRVIVGVLLAEAIWNVIVSATNNIFVPWIGDAMGQSSGLPTSFTQRPYNYPDFFVSFWESCVAVLASAVLNYFVQGRKPARFRSAKSAVENLPGETAPQTFQPARSELTSHPTVSRSPIAEPRPAILPSPVPEAPFVKGTAPESVARLARLEQSPDQVRAAATHSQAVPKIEAEKPAKAKIVYYNLVGERIEADES